MPGATPGGRLTIGIPFDEPGIGVKDGDTYAGFDVETATYVAKALGVPPENITWKEATGADREQLLESGEVDLIVSTFTITDERKQKVDFAGPYFLAHQDLLVRRNEDEITGTETLNGKNLCTFGDDLGGEHPGALPGTHQGHGVPAVLRLRRGPGQQRGRRGDHGRRHPRRLRRRPAVQGQAQGHRQGLLATRTTASASRRATPR